METFSVCQVDDIYSPPPPLIHVYPPSIKAVYGKIIYFNNFKVKKTPLCLIAQIHPCIKNDTEKKESKIL